MEPANIDWTSIESKYIRDELYEHINAPKWLDLSAPSPPVDDEAWFCRSDCRHPKTAKDFQRWSPSPKAKPMRSNVEPMPLGERNSKNESLKRRGGNAKNFREDLENQNPNFSPNTTRPVKILKEAVKSSAVKRGAEEEEMESKKHVPRLRSTLSARNLFSGSDTLLGQISEFCKEIKKMAVGRERTSPAQREAKEDRRVLLETPSKKNDGLVVRKSSRLTVKVVGIEEENYNYSSVLREVRACPPTPQRFPSPSSRRRPLRSTKPLAISSSSPLNNNKPPKSSPMGRRILQDLDKTCEEERKPVRNSNASGDNNTEGSSVDMFWFFKPCTYLVK